MAFKRSSVRSRPAPPGVGRTYRLQDSTQRWAFQEVEGGPSPTLRAVVFFNNLEGKGSCDLMRVAWTLGLRCILPVTFKRGLRVAQTRRSGGSAVPCERCDRVHSYGVK